MAAPAVAMDPELTDLLAPPSPSAGSPDVRLPSGAGHDAVALAELTRTAMLFVRCAGGVSHHPDESVERRRRGGRDRRARPLPASARRPMSATAAIPIA